MSLRSQMRVLRTEQAEPENPAEEARTQVAEVFKSLRRKASDFFRMPWSALDELTGGLPPGDLWYFCAFSGHGKTMFLTSLVMEMIRREQKAYYMPLESSPMVIRTHLACKQHGYDAGDLLSGKYLEWPNHDAVRFQVAKTVNEMASGLTGAWNRLMISRVKYVDVPALKAAAKTAKDFGADVFIIDHVDHIQATAGVNLYEQSVQVNRALLEVAQEYGLRVLAATQLNNNAVRGNKALLHLPPQPDFVKMGGHKREVASGMLGIYRPLKIAGVDKGTMTAFNKGLLEPHQVLEPNTMAVVCMKHRLYGNREGQRVFLQVEHGRVLDANQDLYKSTRLV